MPIELQILLGVILGLLTALVAGVILSVAFGYDHARLVVISAEIASLIVAGAVSVVSMRRKRRLSPFVVTFMIVYLGAFTICPTGFVLSNPSMR
jgi:hypothetical protein